jgi:outer membrane lipoprotein-sorting protein
MKYLAALAIALILPALAHADAKSEEILKEVQLRMKNATTYSVTLSVQDGKDPAKIRFFLQRPDKYRMSVQSTTTNVSIIVNGEKALVKQGEMNLPLPAAQAQEGIDMFLQMISGDFEKALKGVESTTYITQKMLDENTLVDVIDIKGKKAGDSARLYIDSNGLIRKMVSKSAKGGGVMLFVNPEIDEPIPAETFAITEPKK